MYYRALKERKNILFCGSPLASTCIGKERLCFLRCGVDKQNVLTATDSKSRLNTF